jgi:chromosome segregation ATPase
LSRENQINKAMTDFGEEFKIKNEKNKEINETVTSITSRIKDSSEEYQRLAEKYEKLKVRLDDYENTATNDEPLIKLKKACADLKVTLLFLFRKI